MNRNSAGRKNYEIFSVPDCLNAVESKRATELNNLTLHDDLPIFGHSKTPDPTRIPALSVQPLDHKPMTDVVSGWYSGMPREHVDFVVRFADGYVRLARLAADAVMRNPSIEIGRAHV